MMRLSKRLDALERTAIDGDLIAYQAIQMPGEPEPEIVFDMQGNPHRRSEIPDDGRHLVIIRQFVDPPCPQLNI